MSFVAYNDRRVRYYSSSSETFSMWCPDESGYHTFKLGDPFGHNAENSRIEANEDDVSNWPVPVRPASTDRVFPVASMSIA